MVRYGFGRKGREVIGIHLREELVTKIPGRLRAKGLNLLF